MFCLLDSATCCVISMDFEPIYGMKYTCNRFPVESSQFLCGDYYHISVALCVLMCMFVCVRF